MVPCYRSTIFLNDLSMNPAYMDTICCVFTDEGVARNKIVHIISPEQLSEIIENKKLFLSSIDRTDFSLHIDLSEYPSEENWYSLNPYLFLGATRNNYVSEFLGKAIMSIPQKLKIFCRRILPYLF
jgi:hypothetical protein